MINHRALFAAGRRWMLVSVLAAGTATAQAAGAQAQSGPDKPVAAPGPPAAPAEPVAKPAEPSGVEGVTVNAQRRALSVAGLPPDEAAALAAQAAKDEAWRSYRRSTPPLTNDPNDMSKDYPGLQTYLPPQ